MRRTSQRYGESRRSPVALGQLDARGRAAPSTCSSSSSSSIDTCAVRNAVDRSETATTAMAAAAAAAAAAVGLLSHKAGCGAASASVIP